MEEVTANLHLEIKLNPAVYGCTVFSCRGFQQSHNLQEVGPMMILSLQGYIGMNDS